jgi:hypothetical protein
LALLGRLSWERVDGFVMQASEKPAQEETFHGLSHHIACGAQDRFAQPAQVKSFASREMKEDKINERTKPRHDVDQHDKAGDYTQWSRNA